MKHSCILLLLYIVFSASIFQQQPITIAVAANAQYAMKSIEKQYEAETGKQIDLIIGSSGKLCAQIREGGPFDIFLSADMEYPQALYTEGLTTAVPKSYGNGVLVLWTMKDIKTLSMNSLLQTDIKHIAIANPKLAPYGEAAISALNHHKLYEKVLPKIVYGESLSQVNQYVSTQTADIGFTAKSVVLSPEMVNKGTWVEIDAKAYAPIVQGAVLLKKSLQRNHAEDALQFYNYLYSAKAKAIFKQYGYQFTK
ncbi:MAG: molybdate ABC transporter substrate-binding protein [Cytophagales bacterium]|nr:molybdate ABC transporter substrate-binding protein [Cytophaga sp.]